MTTEILAVLIGSVCLDITPPSKVDTKEYRIECIEILTNCMVKEGGEIEEKYWTICKRRWDAFHEGELSKSN